MKDQSIPLLRKVFAAQQARGMSDEALAAALECSFSSIAKWGEAVRDNRPIRLIRRTREDLTAFLKEGA